MPLRVPLWTVLAIVATALLGALSLSYRLRVEARNKAVGIVVEMPTVTEYAAAQGLDQAGALRLLKAKGLTGVVLAEEVVADLVLAGRVSLYTPSDDQRSASPIPRLQQGSLWIDGAPEDLERVSQSLRNRFPKLEARTVESGGGVRSLSLGSLPATLIRRTSIGLNPAEAAIVDAAGLQIVGRFSNVAGSTPELITATLEGAKALGLDAFLPQGDQVLGRRDNLKVTSESLERLGIYYVSPEFAKIGGDINVVGFAPGNVLRLHSAQAAELDKLPLPEAIERYAKAARERNVRLLLLRPVSSSAAAPLDSLGEFVESVAKEIERDGGAVGSPRPFGSPEVPRVLLLALALAAAPVAIWTGLVLISDRRLQVGGAALVLLLALACWTDVGRQYMALLLTLVFPLAAYLVLDARDGKRWPVEYLIVTLISLTGGLAAAGLLNDLRFFVKADAFDGVKLAHFLPIGLIGFWFFRRLTNPKQAMSSPILWGQAVLAMVLLVAFAFMATRTGNDSPAGVSGIELKLRSILDAVLFVRPRTKEFLIGHPMLVVAIFWLIVWKASGAQAERGLQAGWIALALMASAIGQTSVVNTMLHLHTPVTLSLSRIAVGFLAGGIIGALLCWVMVRASSHRGTPRQAEEGQ